VRGIWVLALFPLSDEIGEGHWDVASIEA